MMSMQQRLELERRNKKPADITDLNLDNCKATAMEGLTADYANLESLSLNNVGLQSLAGFPALPKLRRLELSDNRLLDGLQHLAGCPALAQLILSGNRIRDLDALKPLAGLAKLKTLDLYGCPVTEADGYRESVFGMLSQVAYLDGLDAQGQECDEDDDEDDDDEEGEEGGEAGGEGEAAYANGDDDGEDYGEDDDEEEEEEDDEEEVSLSYLQRGNVDDDEEEDDDFDPEAVSGEDDDEDDIDDEDEEQQEGASGSAAKAKGGKVGSADVAAHVADNDADEASSSRRGTKRKHETDGGDGQADD